MSKERTGCGQERSTRRKPISAACSAEYKLGDTNVRKGALWFPERTICDGAEPAGSLNLIVPTGRSPQDNHLMALPLRIKWETNSGLHCLPGYLGVLWSCNISVPLRKDCSSFIPKWIHSLQIFQENCVTKNLVFLECGASQNWERLRPLPLCVCVWSSGYI
jgi:hypothetical protein